MTCKYKVYICFFISFSFCMQSASPDIMYDMGKNLTKGALDEFGNQFSNASDETVANFMQKVAKGSLSGIGQGMQNGGNEINEGLASLLRECGQGIGQGMQEGAKDINAGIAGVLSEVGQGINKGMESGGNFDKGMEQAVDTFSRNFNKGFREIVIDNYKKVAMISLASGAVYYTYKHGLPFAFKMLERYLTKPKLIISSSKKSFYEMVFGSKVTLSPMIFAPRLEERLNDFITVTSTIHKKIKEGKGNVKYRNVMLYGPPGTGKTLFAMELAKRSGLEYACMSGSSFSKFKDGEGIEALDELFAWAQKSSGLLIFIDEAEAFLSSRDDMDPQSKLYQLVNNFLNYTGNRSDKFMFVFATNHQEALDSAMYRRIDDLIEVTLPAKAERIRILNLYKDLILLDSKHNDLEFIESVEQIMTDNVIEEIAELTKGLSGGELEGIINTLKTDTDILDPAIVNKALVDKVVQQAVQKYFVFTNGSFLGSVED